MIGGPRGGYNPYAQRNPHIIGDPFIPGQDPMFVGPGMGPGMGPGGIFGPGGNLVGPGSDMFGPGRGYIDPSLGQMPGGMPAWHGNDPNDRFP
mmetsp:Transcript_15794/g.15234  ORF Transcript_15794/g.15234 Transcript_15794/m.15234 type:complete len:93 (+) Transcript_15794:512-790(+)